MNGDSSVLADVYKILEAENSNEYLYLLCTSGVALSSFTVVGKSAKENACTWKINQ